MTKQGVLIRLAVAAAILSVAALAMAQGMGPQHRVYNPATVTTIRGEVVGVHVWAPRGRVHILELRVRDESGVTVVHLGPVLFVRQQGFQFRRGDHVEVTGSKVTTQHYHYIVAREVVKDGKTLTLRDEQGRPAWAGRR